MDNSEKQLTSFRKQLEEANDKLKHRDDQRPADAMSIEPSRPAGRRRSELSCCWIMTLEEDRADIERIAVSWQDVPEQEQQAMGARLGAMLDYLDPSEDADRQLRHDASRLHRMIEQSLGRTR